MIPSAQILAIAGIGTILLFGVWKTTIAPRIAARRAHGIAA